MVKSMTGYGRVQKAVDGYDILFEIKSVNHRFFEFSAKVPRLYGYIEDKLKVYLQNYISRGKVDVFVTIDPVDGSDSVVRLNESLAGSYVSALREIGKKFGIEDDVTVSTIARYNDIFRVLSPAEDEEKIWKAVKAVAEPAVRGFIAMRETEGERLKNDVVARARNIAGFVREVEKRSPRTVDEYRNRLTVRMKELLTDARIDENRIMLEAALYADKVSVTEETVRLQSHLKQFETMLESGEPVGRKLDFLLQEMNREANTIGSKASDVSIAGTVVNIKAELEKIREQIQNLE